MLSLNKELRQVFQWLLANRDDCNIFQVRKCFIKKFIF